MGIFSKGDDAKVRELEAQIAQMRRENEQLTNLRAQNGQITREHAELQARVVELDRRLQMYKGLLGKRRENGGVDLTEVQEVQELYESLDAAKAKITEQAALLKKLTSPPIGFAIVLKLDSSYHPSQFVKGQKVTVNPANIQNIKPDVVGEIMEDDTTADKGNQSYGRVRADFGGQLDEYRIGRPELDNGASDLILVDVNPLATAVVVADGRCLEVLVPDGMELHIGDQVKVLLQSMQILSLASHVIFGDISRCSKVLQDNQAEIEVNGNTRVVFVSHTVEKLEDGDRVILDSRGSIILKNLGKDETKFVFSGETMVDWDSIGGLVEAKELMRETIEFPYLYADTYKFFNKKPIKGLLMYGPPGCGKTLLAKAAVTALTKINKLQAIPKTGFMYVKGPEILDRYVGTSESIIRQLFSNARKHKQTYGYPAVIFIDEAESILRKRGSGISSDIEGTIVPMFLAEMDGLDESSAIVILATNREDILDSAVIRPGRIDRKIYISRPDKASSKEIFAMYLKQLPIAPDTSIEALAQYGSDTIFHDRLTLYKVALKNKTQLNFLFGHIGSGAMIKGIVDRATSIALRRCLEAKANSGLCVRDLHQSIVKAFQENQSLEHQDALHDFLEDYRGEIDDIQKLRQTASERKAS